MTEWTNEAMAEFAARYGLTWLTPALLEQLTDCANRVVATGRAVPRMASEYDEPAHVFGGPE